MLRHSTVGVDLVALSAERRSCAEYRTSSKVQGLLGAGCGCVSTSASEGLSSARWIDGMCVPMYASSLDSRVGAQFMLLVSSFSWLCSRHREKPGLSANIPHATDSKHPLLTKHDRMAQGCCRESSLGLYAGQH
eukprot:1183795-Rhodomonas_salina.2